MAGRALAQGTPLVVLDYNAAKALGTVQIAGGAIDLTNGALVVTTSSFGFAPSAGNYQGAFTPGSGGEFGTVGVAEYGTAAVHDALQEGANFSGTPGYPATNGYWNGTNGIISSTAANDPNGLFTVGYVDNSVTQYSVFKGVPLDNVNFSQTIFATTWFGDSNLDGIVDNVDYGNWAGTITSGNPAISTNTGGPVGWIDGDFNGDGVVDGVDYGLWAGTITSGKQFNLGFNPSAVGAPAAGSAVQAVPEPSTVALLGVVLLCGFASRIKGKRVSTMSRNHLARLVVVVTVLTMAVFFAAHVANATLYIDLQADPSDPGYSASSPRTLNVTSANETFTVDVYALIANSAGTPANNGIAQLTAAIEVASSTLKGDVAFGSWASTGAGAINTTAAVAGTQLPTNYGAMGLGGTATTDTTNSHWWSPALSNVPAYNGSNFVVSGSTIGTDYFLGTLTVTFTGYTLPTATTSASMVAYPRWGTGATKPQNWTEDGSNYHTFGSAALVGGGPSSTNMLYSNAAAGISPMTFVFTGGTSAVTYYPGRADITSVSTPSPASIPANATASVAGVLTNTATTSASGNTQDSVNWTVTGASGYGGTVLPVNTNGPLAPAATAPLSFTYTPLATFFGTDTITLTPSGTGANGTGAAGTTGPKTATINVTGVGPVGGLLGASFGTLLTSSSGTIFDGLMTSSSGDSTLSVPTTATILAGSGALTQVTEQWRSRTAAESSTGGSILPLVSDVVNMGGIATGTPYVLQMSYDPNALKTFGVPNTYSTTGSAIYLAHNNRNLARWPCSPQALPLSVSPIAAARPRRPKFV
jgi:fumarate reductase subunit D